MRGASLLVDDVTLAGDGAAEIVRVHLAFDHDVWIAIGDPAAGKTIGPVRLKDRGVHAEVTKFANIPQPTEPGVIGIRTSLDVGENLVYIMGVPREHVPEHLQFTLDGNAVPWSQEVSSDERLVCAAHLRHSGMLAIEGRLVMNVEAYLDAVQKPLTVPTKPNLLSVAAQNVTHYAVSDPGKVIEAVRAIFGS